MTAHQMVAKARNLPQISEAALRLVDLLNDAGDNGEAIDLIKSDPWLTAKLLRACNSPVLGLADQVASVDYAILLLGHNQVLNLALSLAFGNALNRPLPGCALETGELCRHAFTVATAAELLVNHGLYPDAEPAIAFTAGLLHDIGRLVMAQALTGEAHAAIQTHMSWEGLGSVEAEREVVGTDHAEVGACLLHVWRLPDSIIEAAAKHHRPVLEPKPQLSAIVHLANRVAHLADAQSEAEAYAFKDQEQIVRLFKINGPEGEEWVDAVRNSANRSAAFLTMV